MRRIIARTLLATGILALAGCLLWAVGLLIPAYQKMLRTGDPAGFGLGLSALLYLFLPLAGVFLLGGLLVDPPSRLLQAPRSIQRTIALLLLGGAITILLSLAGFHAGALLRSARNYSYQGAELIIIFSQNLVLSLPLLAIVVLLTWAGLALWRQRGHLKCNTDGYG